MPRFGLLEIPRKGIRAAGIDQILFTGNIERREEVIRSLGTDVLPRCRN